MSYTTHHVARDGKPVVLCSDGTKIPSSLDRFQFTNPRTGNVEEVAGILAWAGSPDTKCPDGSVPITIIK